MPEHESSGDPILDRRFQWAQASLEEIVRTMDARLVPEASLALPLLGRKLDAAAIAADADLATALRATLKAFARAVTEKPDEPAG